NRVAIRSPCLVTERGELWADSSLFLGVKPTGLTVTRSSPRRLTVLLIVSLSWRTGSFLVPSLGGGSSLPRVTTTVLPLGLTDTGISWPSASGLDTTTASGGGMESAGTMG